VAPQRPTSPFHLPFTIAKLKRRSPARPIKSEPQAVPQHASTSALMSSPPRIRPTLPSLKVPSRPSTSASLSSSLPTPPPLSDTQTHISASPQTTLKLQRSLSPVRLRGFFVSPKLPNPP
jgi:hypothetical protein